MRRAMITAMLGAAALASPAASQSVGVQIAGLEAEALAGDWVFLQRNENSTTYMAAVLPAKNESGALQTQIAQVPAEPEADVDTIVLVTQFFCPEGLFRIVAAQDVVKGQTTEPYLLTMTSQPADVPHAFGEAWRWACQGTPPAGIDSPVRGYAALSDDAPTRPID